MKSKSLLPVILCGGTGTRLWPLSRASYPKQFLALNIQNDKTLLQETYQRIQGIQGLQAPFLICNEEHRFIVAEQIRQINLKESTIFLEPIARNTAPAIALAAIHIINRNPNSIMGIYPADHLIIGHTKFEQIIKNAQNQEM